MPYSAYTWQQSFTSAAAEHLPIGRSPPMNHLMRSQDDISLLELRDVAAAVGGWETGGGKRVHLHAIYLNTVLHLVQTQKRCAP